MPAMKRIAWVLALNLVAQVAAHSRDLYVQEQGRKVQIDGFLVEWSEEGRRELEQDVYWDAVNTAEGVAGYFQAAIPDTCDTLAVALYPDMNALHRRIVVRLADPKVPDSLYAVSRGDGDSALVTAEWIVPWSMIKLGDDGLYGIGLSAEGGCRGGVAGVVLKGSAVDEGSVLTRRVRVQFLIIAIMLVLYIALRIKAGRLKRKPIRLPGEESDPSGKRR